MPGSQTPSCPPRPCQGGRVVLPSRQSTRSAYVTDNVGAQWLACVLPCCGYTRDVTAASVQLAASMTGSFFTGGPFHSQLQAGLSQRFRSVTVPDRLIRRNARTMPLTRAAKLSVLKMGNLSSPPGVSRRSAMDHYLRPMSIPYEVTSSLQVEAAKRQVSTFLIGARNGLLWSLILAVPASLLL